MCMRSEPLPVPSDGGGHRPHTGRGRVRDPGQGDEGVWHARRTHHSLR